MIDYHRFCQIKHLHDHQGLNASQIAQEVALDRRTVAYWLAQDHFRPRKPRPHASKLDPFKPEIVRLLERHPYSAAQVFQRLREHGFAGSYELVKTYVRTVRPTRHPAFLTLAFAVWSNYSNAPFRQQLYTIPCAFLVLHSTMPCLIFTVSR